MASYGGRGSAGSVEWVESGGGPLIAVPDGVLPFWTGAAGDELASDYDRACEVEGPVGLLPVGNATALVLGEDPASTSYLPELGMFVRWFAGDPERGLPTGPPAAPDTVVWGREMHWEVPGPVVLFDAACPGEAHGKARRLRIPLAPGRYTVRAAHAGPGARTWTGLVRLRPVGR